MPRASGLGLAALAFALVALGCSKGPDPSRILASGHVEATEVKVSTKIGGTIESLPVHEGDRVALGQELARIDSTDLRLALKQLQAERDRARAELDLRLAGTRKEDLAALGARLAQARADLDGAEKELVRMAALLERGSGTTQASDAARTRRDMARGRLEAARQDLARGRAGSRAQEKEAARAALASAEARIAQVERQISDTAILSPAAGVVTAKLVEAGELVSPGAGICVVTDLASAWLTVYVSEPDLARIRLGQAAVVRTDDGGESTGKITFIASQAEFTPKNVQTRDERVKLVFRVKVGLANADGRFKPGMPAEARMQVAGG